MDAQVFASDISLPNILHAVVLRSAVARGRLARVECPELPEGSALVTAADIPGENRLWGSDLPILAGGELSYVGEPVALLLGPDAGELEGIAARCAVVAEEERGVFTVAEAEARAQEEASLVAARREVCVGDPDGAFASAASVVRSEHKTGIQEHWYSEPCAAVAWVERREESRATGERDDARDPDEGAEDAPPALVVRTATSWPRHARKSVERAIGPASAVVSVRPCATGVHLDGKFWYPSLVACHAALGAWITGRPTRAALGRKEDFLFSPKRPGATITVASAFDEKGELVGTDVEAKISSGAYGVGAQETLDQVCIGSLGLYASKNARFRGAAYATNVPPQGPFAGFGLAQGFFASERHASLVAENLGRDPAEWRKASFGGPGFLPLQPSTAGAIPARALLDAAAAMSDYRRKAAAYELLRRKRREPAQEDSAASCLERGQAPRGIGIALGCQGNGLLHPERGEEACVELTLEKDGSLEIRTGLPGPPRETAWEEIAREILGVEAENVRTSHGGAAGVPAPESGPAVMSRKATAIAELVEKACLAIRGQRFRDPLPISVSVCAERTEDSKWGAALMLPDGGLPDRAPFLLPGAAAAVVEVEIDPVERVPRTRGVWLAADGGRIYREEKAVASLRLGVAQALGWAQKEQLAYVLGRIPDGGFESFEIPGALDTPPISVEFQRDAGERPKGIGDLPFACVPAAYAQAVSQAADWDFLSIPLKAQDAWLADAAKRKEGRP